MMFYDRGKLTLQILEKFERTNHEIIQQACKSFNKSRVPVYHSYETCHSPKI